MTQWLHCHFSVSCIEEGNGNPLQCSCLENPRDGGAWWAAIYGVTQSWTQLKRLSSRSSSSSSISTTPYQVVTTLMILTPWCWSFQVKYKYSTGCIYTKTLFVVYLKFKITWMLHIFICQFYQASLEGLTSVSRCQSLKMECKLICQISFLLKEVFFFFPLKGEVNVWANCEQKKSQGNDLQE